MPDALVGRGFRCRVCQTVLRAEPEFDTFDESDIVEDDDDGVELEPPPARVPAARPPATLAKARQLSLAPPRAAEPPPERARRAVHDPRPYRDVDTWASNPGRMRLTWAGYLAAYPPVHAIAATVIGACGLFYHWAWALVVLSGPFILIRDFLRERNKFRAGDVNPAVVVSERPFRVAVLADMTLGRAPKPAVTICAPRAAAVSADGATPPVGTRLAAVCMYFGRADLDAWVALLPTIVQGAERDPDAVDAVMASIPRRDWDALDAQVAQLDRYKLGIYRMWEGGKWRSTGGTTKLADALGPVIVAISLAVITPVAMKQMEEKRKKGERSEGTVELRDSCISSAPRT
ncbi:MAG: DUF3239 domain-containing protein [Phycisphaerae bacterium]